MKKNKNVVDDKTKKVGIILFLLGFVAGLLVVFYFGISYIDKVEEENKLDDYSEVEVPKHHESDITKSSEKVNIYLFWGNGCGHCSNLKAYMASIEEEYGKYYNLYTFEVWSDAENEALMNKMAAVMGDNLRGVPYMVIGSDSFKGYSSNVDSRILASIKAQYEKEDRYDAYEHIDE